ncbi:MAG: GGDEF domain-containing protein [Nitrospirota bacterium]
MITIEQSEMKDKLLWLVRLRWAGCVGVLVITHVVREIAGLTFPLIPVYLILGFTTVYNAYFQQRLKSPSEDLIKNAIAQISLDFIVLTAAVYFSGGCDSPFLYYYIFHIVISGIILPIKWTFRFAVAAIVLPAAVMWLKHVGILPHFAILKNEPVLFADLSVIAAYGGVFASTLILTAYFVAYLSDRLYKKQDEIRRLYLLSEKLRSSIVMDDVIEIAKEELSAFSGSSNIECFRLDKNKVSLVHNKSDIAIPLSGKNIFTDTFLSCEARWLDTSVISSEYEDVVIKILLKDAKEITVLPIRAAFTTKCYEYFHCPPDSSCPAHGSDDRRCWYTSSTYCHGRILTDTLEKLKACMNCDMFTPAGIFVMDVTRRSKLEPRPDLDACMRLLDAASLAVSNAKLYEKTLELSETDGLTGLKNRRAFLKLLESEIHRAQRYVKHFGLIMIDIDHFKHYNDTNGHPQGDILLKMLADMLNEHIRETDTVSRYGGEEFIMLLPETGKDEAISIAERIRCGIAKNKFPRAESQPSGKITVSIGAACYPEDGDSPEKIIRAADDALYVAKETGRNIVVAANRPEALI